jgi:hypothetical protein
MSTTVAIAALLASVLATISFLIGTTYTDRTRNRAYRRLVEEQRELNAVLAHKRSLCTTSPHRFLRSGTSRQATLPQSAYDQDPDDD